MKKLLIVTLLAALTGCATHPQPPVQAQTTVNYATTGSAQLQAIKDPLRQMDRTDVIQAARDCINAKMKPVVQNLPQQTTHGVIVIPVFVSCEFYRD